MSLIPNRLKILGWTHNELYVQVEYDGKAHWVPVDTANDGDVVWVRGTRYSAETGDPKPKKDVL